MNKQRGISQIAVMIVMLVLAIALPITTNLIKQSQENRSKAAESYSYYQNWNGVCTKTDINYESKASCESALSACNSNTRARNEGWACYENKGTCYTNSSCVTSAKPSCSSLGGSCMNVATCNEEGGSVITGTDCSAACCKVSTPTTCTGKFGSSSTCVSASYCPDASEQGHADNCGSGLICCPSDKVSTNTVTPTTAPTTGGSSTCNGTYHCVYSGANNCAGYCIDECGNKDTSSAYDNCGSATTGTSYWYYTTADVTLTTGAVIAKGTCQQTSSTYASQSDCQTALNTNLSGKTSGVCYASQSACTSANTATGSSYWYLTTADITLTTGAVIPKGTCQQTSNTYASKSTCESNLNNSSNNTYGKTTGTCYASQSACDSANTVVGAPTITSASAVASGTSIKISAVGVSIDHASITASDKSTFVGNMTCSGTTSCTYTVSGLTNGTTYTYWVKACSVNKGDTCPAANTAWKSVTAKAGSIASIVNIKLAFAGVKLNNGQCATNWPVTLKMVDNTGKSVVDQVFNGVPTQTASVNSKGEIIYDFNVTVNNVPGTGGSDLAFFLAGPKHISLKYGKNNQSGWYSNLAGTLGLTGGSTNNYDFSGYSLLAGDVTGNTAGTPDGKIDGRDFSYIKEKANVLASGAAGTNVSGDLDGNCQVNSGDVRLIKQSLTEINGQTY